MKNETLPRLPLKNFQQLFVTLVILLLVSTRGFSATQTVTVNNDSGAGSLREAIANAASGDVIVFNSSLANQTLVLSSTLIVPAGKSLTIDGTNAVNFTISGNNAIRVFLLQSTSVQPTTLSLIGLKIINGKTIEYGGGIRSEHQGKINLTNCIFNGNVADDGGSAVFSAFEGMTTINNCKFDGNISIANNTERGSTVMLYGPASQTIKNSEFTNNKGINGAAINGLNAPLLIEDCIFTANQTTDAFFDTGESNDFLRGYGGAIYVDRASQGPPSVVTGSIILRRCKFENNIGTGEGGACYLYTDETDDVLIDECYFNNNESRTLAGGTNGGSGGAIQHMNNAKNLGFVVKNSTFSNNQAAVLAGAIRADWADTQISNCTFYNNKALLTALDGYSANGGALAFFSMSNSTVDITNCTFANNSAGWVGGAIVSSDPLNTKIKNNIFYQNTANNGGNNWGIQQHAAAEMTDLGGNIQFPNKLTNNFNDYNVSASVTIADPLLSSLANNGGFSPTMALQTGSPAINAGSGCSPADQRGVARIGNCDIGAFEYQSTLPVTLVSFTAKKSVSGVEATWQTSAELNSSHFELLHATDVSGFMMIANITSTGNATTGENYSFKHAQPVNGNNYYKLVQVDKNGDRTEFDVKSVRFQLGGPSEEVLLFPNPASHVATLKFAANTYTKLEVLDMFGRVVISKKISNSETEVEINVAQLSSGVYSVALGTANSRSVHKLIKL